MSMELNLPAGYYHANMLFTGAAAPNGAAMTFGGSAEAAGPTVIANAINAAWIAHLRSQFSSNLTFNGTRVKNGPMADGPFSHVSASSVGSLSGVEVSPNVCFLVRKLTALGGRQGAGRMYQPGCKETAVGNDGVVGSSDRIALQAAWDAFLTALTTSNIPMYLLHMHGSELVIKNGTAVTRTTPLRAPTLVQSLSVDGKVATQRRRLR